VSSLWPTVVVTHKHVTCSGVYFCGECTNELTNGPFTEMRTAENSITIQIKA